MMKIVYMTREYPPNIYGGAGVHVEHLAGEVAKLANVEVKCFGDQRSELGSLSVRGYPFKESLFRNNPQKVKKALMVLLTGLHFNALPIEADIIHCHTWYAAWAGILAKLCYGIPLLVTVHSLEPLRPWKREQLGRGYDLSLWLEKTALEMAEAVIAVSSSSRQEILSHFRVDPRAVHVIHNGIDVNQYKKVTTTEALRKYSVDPRVPYVLFLGRISRQKGILEFVNAVRHFKREIQVVLCTGTADTPELAREVKTSINRIQSERNQVVWIQHMVTRKEAVELYSHAAVFCCPSMYEPFGLINLEAMACETAVVATAVGGIKDVVLPGETGVLVDLGSQADGEPAPALPDRFARDFANAVNELISDEERRKRMARRGRERAEREFGWDKVALEHMKLYQSVADKGISPLDPTL
jgi:starch synthase